MEWTLPDAHQVIAEAVPDRDMLVWKDRRRTYAEVATRVRKLAGFLARRGLGLRRERAELSRWECGQATVALILYNGPEYIETMLGALRARAVPFNVNQHYRPEEIGGLLDMLGAEAIVYHRALGPRVSEAASSRRPGSTGEPKGVIHGHGALIRHLDNLNRIRRYTRGEVLFSNSPFFWIGGLAYSLLGTLVAGARLVCSNCTDAAGVLDLLERERPTLVNGFAQSVAHLPRDPSFAGRDLSSIRRGNLFPILPESVRPADPDLRHAMLGMTETGSVCLASDDESDQPERRRGSFGRPVPGFEAVVVDPESRSRCGPNEPGELHLRGPFLMEGYYGRERHEVFDADGWYRTGDWVVVDEEGFFYFRGRRGDVIKTSGANVSPLEVEAAIRDLTGLTAHVLGLPDDARGQLVAAAIRVADDRVVDVDALRTRLSERLSRYKVPRRFLLLADDAVPLLSSGKLDRHALEALFDAR